MSFFFRIFKHKIDFFDEFSLLHSVFLSVYPLIKISTMDLLHLKNRCVNSIYSRVQKVCGLNSHFKHY